MQLIKKIHFDKIGLSEEAISYLSEYVDFNHHTVIINTYKINDINDINAGCQTIINSEKVNNLRFNNKFFEAVNSKLPINGYFVGRVETYSGFRVRKNIFYIPIIKYFYFFPIFIFRRVIPRIKGLKRFFYSVTKGRNRLISKAETLGRLVSCGFEIISYKTINGLLYFVVKKVEKPHFNMQPSYGPIYQMPRIGKDGKIILVNKIRTMHPYSEYLQDFVIAKEGYATSGKPDNDFRVAQWGKIIRKYWLDEIPQLINVLKGDMKLVGVRPVSESYFKKLPEEVKRLRLKYKPGCIPPYVSLNRKSSVEDVVEAELEYLLAYEKDPYFTDFKFFITAIINIIFRGKRSA